MSDVARIQVRRMVLLRQPPERVYAALRDELPTVAAHMSGIDEVRALERSSTADGVVHTVHEWRAAAAVAAALAQHIDTGALSWVERAQWHDASRESRWSVESRLLRGSLTGSGSTRVEPAMGGRGSRVAFEVSTSLAAGSLGPMSRFKAGFEDAAATLLAKTLQELGVAVEQYLSDAK